MSKIYYVYKITNIINRKSYVGFTSNCKRRWGEEKSYAFNPKCKNYNYPLSRAFRKYTKNQRNLINDFFSFEIIEECKTIEEAVRREMFYILFFNTFSIYGYNQNEGGLIPFINGRKHTEEAKQKMSKTWFKKGERSSPATEFKSGIIPVNRKLTIEQANKLRDEYKQLCAGNTKYGLVKKILIKYNVSASTFKRIIDNECYKIEK